MKTKLLFLTIGIVWALSGTCQSAETWTEQDRNYLLQHLIASRDSLIAETKNLTEKQWNFKESPDRWSIAQVVEHIAIWELLYQREISLAIAGGLETAPPAAQPTDSSVLAFLMEEHPHNTTEYTKPFTFSVPMGLSGSNSLLWLLKMREESINFLRSEAQDLRAFRLKPGRKNVHQTYISTFGHADRHLRQIRKIKAHPNYPK
ncbi:MAG TPA: DinB family protein [Flavisolibacter sp.]|jgi:hypothetical protein|nr:DinB family protein [Flavisolibacter sp.]